MVRGVIAVTNEPAGLRFTGTVVGLVASMSGGWHVHEGFSCNATAAQALRATGGHYYDAGATDPWTLVRAVLDARLPPCVTPPTAPIAPTTMC